MRPKGKRVAVVGGGVVGLISIKTLNEEGLEPTCFEKSNDICGIWKYREQDIQGLPSLMCTTTANHSKEFFLSDFLMPKTMPNYLKHCEVNNYFRKYAEKFDLLRHILFNREVVNIKKTSDYEETGRWSISVKDTTDGTIKAEIFDAVCVCVGHMCYPHMAEYPGIGQFEGKIMHTHSLKTFEKFLGQRVAIVGMGCSALDAAVAISDVAKQVYLSIRTPSWILSRIGPHGIPFDFVVFRRYITFFQKILPIQLCSWLLEQIVNNKFNHQLYGIEPKYPLLARDPIFNDSIAARLLLGSVVLRKDIRCFNKKGIMFEGEDKIAELDTVIMATGYTWKLDFLEKGIFNIENGRFNLYKCMYPTNLKHPTLALIAFILSFGSGFPLSELQVRWAAHLFANNKTLPSEEIMLKDAKERHETNSKRFSPSEKMSIRVDFVPYADEIATELGVMPNFWKMAFTDPRLFVACIFGACIPAQYRLVGPNKWGGAREAVLTSSERMQTPLSGERLKNKHLKSNAVVNIFFSVLIACLLYWKDLPLYFVIALFIACYVLRKKVFSNFFLILFFVAYLCNRYGFIAIYILTIAAFLYLNYDRLFINKFFWT